MFNWLKRLWHGKNSSVAEERGEESQGRSKREGSSKLQGGNTKASSKKRRQSSKSKLPSKDGGDARTRKGFEGKTNKTSSQSKSVGSVKQSRRKTKSGGNLKAKQI